MDETKQTNAGHQSLVFILIVAVLQGWALYGLHHAIDEMHWPATQPAWLFGFYGIALFVPITLQLLAGFTQRRDLWVITAVLAVAYFYFGWHHGSWVHLPRADEPFGDEDGLFALGIEACVLWLMLLPFLQTRLIAGRWNAHYPTLFASAWNNILMLAEAALFTGLFWLLLALWAALFQMLEIGFFRDLFREPIFIYPVTALTFGIALRLIGSIDRLTSVVLEQVLSVLKWLAIVAGVILTLFTLALIAKLPGLIVAGQRAIGAAWLLWLVAVIVLLLNAAYRDGTVARPYPRTIAQMLRWVVPLIVVIAVTAVYALIVRTNTYGLTVERVWAFIVAGAAVIYAVGYAISAFDRTGWLPGIARINVIVSLALIATIACALTPILSPHRLAANSQFEKAQQPLRTTAQKSGRFRNAWQATPFQYLRFDSGRYGLERLRALTSMDAGPGSARIRKTAQFALDQKRRGYSLAMTDPESYVAKLRLFPKEREVEPALQSAMTKALGDQSERFQFVEESQPVGLFVDLNADGNDEFILMNPHGGMVFTRADAGWSKVGRFFQAHDIAGWKVVLRELSAGEFKAAEPRWRDLELGKKTIRVVPQ